MKDDMSTNASNYLNLGSIWVENCANDLNFNSQAKMALNILRSRPIGAGLLRAISVACARGAGISRRNVVIEKAMAATAIPSDDTSDGFREQLKMPGNGSLANAAFEKTVRGRGGSLGAIARWNPSNIIAGTTIERPSYIALAHELIHCLHFMSGDCPRAPTRQFDLTIDSGLAEEEARTIGLGAYDYPRFSEEFCENAFRDAFNQPKRTQYAPGITLQQAVRTR
jgi:hypothetical protein